MRTESAELTPPASGSSAETPTSENDMVSFRPARRPDEQRYEFQTDDGLTLSMRRKRSRADITGSPIARGRSGGGTPVLLVHGAGVRSRIFNAPIAENLDDVLLEHGFDVWNLDWRASIDQAPNHWTLDQAAVYDYPAAIQLIQQHTGKQEIKAVVHCQGSTSFMLSLVAGLLPDVSTVVCNAVSLHPMVPTLARLKALYAVPILGPFVPFLNPQWGLSCPSGLPWVLNAYVNALHHECDNPVCKWSSFAYGSGFPTLWRHENLNEGTHEWLKGEFAHVPMTFFNQMTRCIKAGQLVTTGLLDSLPDSIESQAPRTDARVVFTAGRLNACFKAESQERSFDWMDRQAPGRHVYHEFARYGHLDVFMGQAAPEDIFPVLVDELLR